MVIISIQCLHYLRYYVCAHKLKQVFYCCIDYKHSLLGNVSFFISNLHNRQTPHFYLGNHKIFLNFQLACFLKKTAINRTKRFMSFWILRNLKITWNILLLFRIYRMSKHIFLLTSVNKQIHHHYDLNFIRGCTCLKLSSNKLI